MNVSLIFLIKYILIVLIEKNHHTSLIVLTHYLLMSEMGRDPQDPSNFCISRSTIISSMYP